ncbi:DUF1203 domain-containing protein [Jannaschia marina]|uniref:DUF1203 domain-containing protein n=1 Tax=Jannaschia marina TaxID=2741674 RepID=UPI0015CC300F|nr:DUF1203 domain-containing protein [Jannaschia marina]
MTFQITALPEADFAPLFAKTDAELAAMRACRRVVADRPGAPCRISLEEAEVGETVILTHHAHQTGHSPYAASHAIYVRDGVRQARLAVAEVPDVIRSRLISLRLFDVDHMMVDADVMKGTEVSEALAVAFARSNVDYAHLHFAKAGCFAASAKRAG